MKCFVCGATDASCGGPTTGRPVDDNLIIVVEKNMPPRDDMVRVDRGDGILVKMTEEEAANFEATKDQRSDRTQVYNYAIETQQVTPSSPAEGDRVVSSRTLRRSPASSTPTTAEAGGPTGEAAKE